MGLGVEGLLFQSSKLMGRARPRGDACRFVRDCLEEIRVLDQDAPFFEAVDTITGIVTIADLSREYHEKAAPFLLLEEVEDRIRILIDRNLSATEIRRVKDPAYDGSEASVVPVPDL